MCGTAACRVPCRPPAGLRSARRAVGLPYERICGRGCSVLCASHEGVSNNSSIHQHMCAREHLEVHSRQVLSQTHTSQQLQG